MFLLNKFIYIKLFELKKILEDIYVKNFDDVRKALKYYEADILNKISLK